MIDLPTAREVYSLILPILAVVHAIALIVLGLHLVTRHRNP